MSRLKQSLRVDWYAHINIYLLQNGFGWNMVDTNVYVKIVGTWFVAITLYRWLSYNCKWFYNIITTSKCNTCLEFETSDMGEIKFCLGIHIRRNCQLCIVELNQFNYINDVLKRYGMEKLYTNFHSISIWN